MSITTLCDLLDASARRWPERRAIGDVAGAQRLTYQDLGALTRQVAERLHALGIGTSDTVAVFSDNCIEFAPAALGVVSAGAAAPLDPQRLPARRTARLAALKATATIVPAHLYDAFVAAHPDRADTTLRLTLTVDADSGPHVSITAGAATTPAATDLPRPAADDVALVMLTSGTTSEPKTVPLTHANVLAAIQGIVDCYRLDEHDATLLVMPLFHGHGLIAGLLATLASGGSAYLPRGGRFHATTFWEDMITAGATWYTAVPTIHQILLARAAGEYPKQPPRLRFIRSCSAPLAPAVLGRLQTAFAAPVLNAYGMTETSHQAASNPLPSDGPDKPASVGLPTGVQIRVIAADGTPARAGEAGAILVRGAAVTSGYRDNPAANSESFTDGWFHTGDLGYLDRDGYLSLTGRTKEIINRGGEKISPADIDTVLQSHPSVQDALAFGVPDEKYGEEIDAAIILRPGLTATEDQPKVYLQNRLSVFETPKRFYFVDDFPRTPKGTGDRRQLAATLTGDRPPAGS
jgi:acyl-CoA synthetase (AMP-forming)/AMP-acid ligase II